MFLCVLISQCSNKTNSIRFDFQETAADIEQWVSVWIGFLHIILDEPSIKSIAIL